jgi:hypothetical protein
MDVNVAHACEHESFVAKNEIGVSRRVADLDNRSLFDAYATAPNAVDVRESSFHQEVFHGGSIRADSTCDDQLGVTAWL